MELRQLRAFQAVARENHFGRAAERLQVVPSSVTVQVRRLESELDVALFDRTTRRTALTEAGRLLLPLADQILASTDQAVAAMNTFVRHEQRKVVLGTDPDLSGRIDAICAAYARLEPEGELTVITCTGREKLRRVRDGDVDAAVLASGELSGFLERVPVWSDPLVAAIPAGAESAPPDGIALGDLADIPLRLPSQQEDSALHALVLTACAEAGFTPSLGPVFTTDVETLTAIAADPGPSWAVFTAGHAARLSSPGVTFRRLMDPAPAATTWLALGRRRDSPGVQSLIKACREAGSEG